MTAAAVIDRSPPKDWIFREGTHDREIWRCVVEEDEYRIAGKDLSGGVIIDVGAHIGSFSWWAMQNGANRVFPYESSFTNVRVANANMLGGVTESAVWGNVGRPGSLRPSTNHANTGGGDVCGDDPCPCDVTTLDEIIRQESTFHGDRVRLLKLDCEHSEFPILLHSNYVYFVDEIVGEYHELGPGTFHDLPLPKCLRFPGIKALTRDLLREALEWHGFDEIEINHEAENIGKFFARRTK